MKELVLHIGFDKCASTTLHEKIFKLEKNYLGTFVTPKIGVRNFANELKSNVAVEGRLINNFKGSQIWLKELQAYCEENGNFDSVLLSSEYLSQRNKIEPWPIITYLKGVKPMFDSSKTNLKVLVIFRSQFTKLASL